jgi:hypothetical protein
MDNTLRARFQSLLGQHVQKLKIYGSRATGLCPFHPDRSPSFSADLERGVWFCFPCCRGGGVKDFAFAVGEHWGPIRYSPRDRARFTVQARRRQAEEQARAILVRRSDERERSLWMAWFEVNAQVEHWAYLLGLFFRRPHLADEFPELTTRIEREYGEALFRCSIIEARLAGEVE